VAADLIIHADGACRGNPGPGGWGVVLSWKDTHKELSGADPATTNNRMELTAVIMGLDALKGPTVATVQTDSQYVIKGITEWLPAWKARGWRTAAKAPVKNEDLWRRLDEARLRHEVDWRWVKGHAGHEFNERADVLARQGMTETLAAAGR
jgi:ribonuclease HI